jgi:hypothetical protein
MRFVLEVDLDKLTGDANAEVARILRYWAGAVRQLELTPDLEQTLMDSGYSPVGSLRVVADG